MKYSYYRWALRLVSLIAITYTMFLELRWASTLYQQGLLLLIPVALIVPALMVYILFGLKPKQLRPDDPADEFYRSLRADFIRFVLITFPAMGLDFFWKH